MKTLAEATKIKESAETRLLKQPGVTGMDVGYRVVEGKQTSEPAIRIYVTNLKDIAPEIKNLKEIEGVPVEVIERQFTLH
jgi:hypothetical protein